MARRRLIRRRPARYRDGEFHEAIPASQTSFVDYAEADYSVRPMVASLVMWLTAVVETILALRLLLRLFAANPGNGFVSAVYEISRPLVQPFFGVLGVQLNTGPGAFETATAVAMIVYGLLAYLTVALINAIGGRRV